MMRHGIGRHCRRAHTNRSPTKSIRVVTWGQLMHTNVGRARCHRFADWMCHKCQGVFDEVQVRQGERGGPNCTPFVIPKNDVKASMILGCSPGNAADPEPPPHFILDSSTALGEWLQV